MTPRPLHRSKTLWLGILILTSLLWIWMRGRDYYDHLDYRLGSATWYGFGTSCSYVSWGSNTYISIPPATNHLRWGSSDFKDPRPFPPPWEIHVAEPTPGTASSRYSVAHWLLILLFLLTWSTFLAWRWRRIRRLTKPPTASAGPAP